MASGCNVLRGDRTHRGRDGRLQHAFETADVEHLGLERDATRLLDARRAVAAHQAEKCIDPANASPGQRDLEQGGGKTADCLPVLGGLALEEGDIAQRVSALVRREIARVDGAAARRLARMSLSERTPT